MRFIGVDLHSNSLTACYLDPNGREEMGTFDLKELVKFQASLAVTDEIAVEATGNTRHFKEAIKDLVSKVVVVNPNQFEVIRKSVKKTDRHDARTLALFLSKEMLPQSRLKEPAHAQLNSVAHTRDKLIKLRTTLINKLHALHVAAGIKSKKSSFSSVKGLNAAVARSWDELTRAELEVIVSQIGSLNEGIKRLDRQLAEHGRRLVGHRNLTSIKGIGDKSAAVLLSVIGEISDFAGEDKLASYFGLVPRVANSNETVHHGRITKRGSKLGRTTLVQCTLVAVRYSPYLKNFYERIKTKKGAGKAIIATARKFLGIIYRTLKYDWVFADFPNFVLAED
ncbi:MAG TPA: IS110 family transposase [Pyrinomonadaceae bacterium]|nr:IS110 family transposase [Pyrinomonadaceae bacterium]